jgi:hypothetical protein
MRRTSGWLSVGAVAVATASCQGGCGEGDGADIPPRKTGGTAGEAPGGTGGRGGASGASGKGGVAGRAGSSSTGGKAGGAGSAGRGGGGRGGSGGKEPGGAGGGAGEPDLGGQGGAGGEDSTAPTIALVASSTRVIAAGQVTLTATADDDEGVVDVTFDEGNAPLGTDATEPYEAVVSYTAADTGIHDYRAVARDAAGNTAQATARVTVVIDAVSPIWKKQLNGVRQTTPGASLSPRALALDESGRPLLVTRSAQGDEDAWRYSLGGAIEALAGTGTSNPSASLRRAISTGADTVAILGVTDGCGCSGVVHPQLLLGPTNLLVTHRDNLAKSGESDDARGLAVDGSGNLYYAGGTRGTISDQGASPRTNPGAGSTFDGFLVKVSAAGVVQWARQWGTAANDVVNQVVVDTQGRIWATGTTDGGLALSGQTAAGGVDAWVVVHDADGALVATQQFGTAEDDVAIDVARLAGGGVVVAGHGGALAGATTTAGDTLGGVDGWIRRYDAAFAPVGTLRFGTAADDLVGGVATGPADDVWVSGTTAGVLAPTTGALKDAFVRRYAGSTAVFTRQVGTAVDDSGSSVAVDASGNAFVTGTTAGDLFAPLEGATDAFLLSLGPLGTYR